MSRLRVRAGCQEPGLYEMTTTTVERQTVNLHALQFPHAQPTFAETAAAGCPPTTLQVTAGSSLSGMKGKEPERNGMGSHCKHPWFTRIDLSLVFFTLLFFFLIFFNLSDGVAKINRVEPSTRPTPHARHAPIRARLSTSTSISSPVLFVSVHVTLKWWKRAKRMSMTTTDDDDDRV